MRIFVRWTIPVGIGDDGQPFTWSDESLGLEAGTMILVEPASGRQWDVLAVEPVNLPGYPASLRRVRLASATTERRYLR